MKEYNYEVFKKNEEWLNNERKKLIRLNKGIIELFTNVIGYGNTADLVKFIVDNETDPEIINSAKYIMYWVEYNNLCDYPEITKYNNYKEVSE